MPSGHLKTEIDVRGPCFRTNPVDSCAMRLQIYLTSTFAPASSSFFLKASESALDTASLTVEGTPSTRSFASFRPRPVISRITLITVTFLSAGYSFRRTVNSVFSSTGAAAAPPPAGAAATATGAAAGTPNFFSKSEMSSTTSTRVNLEIASRISSLLTAMFGSPIINSRQVLSGGGRAGLLVPISGERARELGRRLVQQAGELLHGRLERTEKHRQRLFARRQAPDPVEMPTRQYLPADPYESRYQLVVGLRKVLHHARGRARIVLRESEYQRPLELGSDRFERRARERLACQRVLHNTHVHALRPRLRT